MLPLLPRRKALGLYILSAAFVLAGMRGSGQEKPGTAVEPAKKNPEKPRKFYFGVSACTDCHSKEEKQRGGRPVVCRCNEATKWEAEDKHKNAYNVLNTRDPDPKSNARAKRMGQILGYNPETKKECLTCHSIYVSPREKEENRIHEDTFKVSDGVSCVACHGAYEDWVDPHGGLRRDLWRKKTREEKEKEFGMIDLWDPIRRTEVCASCHLGNSKEGKVVTHEMYAAGHPPLPGFETATFGDGMPRHWQLRAEKSSEAQKLLDYSSGDLEQTKLVMVSAIASFLESMRQLADEAEKSAEVNQSLDLAQFDCAACHHDLLRNSWRQERGYRGKPGRPQFRAWSTAFLKLGIRQADPTNPANAVDEKMEPLRQVFDEKPLGDPKKVAEEAKKLANWSGSLARTLNAKIIDRATAARFLRDLAKEASANPVDFETARQIAWGFKIVYEEVYPDYKKSDKNRETKIRGHLDALNKGLQLGLGTWPIKTLEEYYPATLAIAGDYGRPDSFGPKKFQEIFAELSKLLP
jgi:hypothetical protein